ncbi:ubiquinol-cytochrome c reductase iron-sulfur subunit [Aromatoleum evansii]|uniref:Ubiquinol-cytochrome c reductase iron-sulfur subunit n=1 Tax=Aromatoleum evansii TaxID=59406 RepID=A0ABZ1AH92_AROEV|nr:ubiquinol-cytochrome c reductase iron-sulfur subunit [Aromatoleum evansii]NMG29804.1 Rieske 2Fe-2S domain-containing protein [Aromatoleum evansii]WRL44870.1 ubiquinol-cytochrome c reductase iron-sulfur subunit [Aromatoleum evansii]
MEEKVACGCAAPAPVNTERRKIFKIAAVGLAAGMGLQGRSAHALETVPEALRHATGDLLVEEDAEGEPAPLKVADLRVGKPLLAFPYHPESKLVRSETRLNKVVLLRFKEEDLDAETKALSAGGVLAFSAICTHMGCDIKTFMTSEKVFACFCHASKFRPLERGSVAGGPAPRPLPVLPLKLDGDTLVIAGPFATPPGFTAQA